MSIGKRLEEARKSKGFRSQNSFADALGISYPTISRWESDITAIPSDKCAKMSEMGLDILFILTGKKQFEKSDPLQVKSDLKIQELQAEYVCQQQSPEAVQTDEDYAFIPLYDVQVSAGNGSFFERESIKTHLAFTKYSLRNQGLQPKKLVCVQGKGDSMYPTINEGDTIMIDLRTKDPDGGIFVFRHGGSLFLKRLMREAEGIRVISDNSIYPAWVIKENDDFEIIGKKVWQAKWG